MATVKFDRFSRRARNALTLAHEEATLLQHNYIGTEHLLLALARQEEGAAAQVLHGLGVDATRLRQAVREIVGEGRSVPGTRVSITPRTKRAIEAAVTEAARMGMNYISPEHLLLGLVAQSDSTAVVALHALGVAEGQVRERLLAQSSQAGAQAEEPRPGPALRATSVRIDQEWLYCELSDRRMIRVPLTWYQRLYDASPEERANYQLLSEGEMLNWPDLRFSVPITDLLAPRRPLGESN